jgi:hypothetical protein
MGDPAKLESVDIEIDFIVFKLKTKWVNDPKQRETAYALYIEYSTRVASQPLDLDQGLIREALSSLHELFDVSRSVLRSAGPVAGVGDQTVGGITLTVLNKALRPFLTTWHPLLLDWEAERKATSQRAHERAWDKGATCRGELEKMRAGLVDYTRALKRIIEH